MQVFRWTVLAMGLEVSVWRHKGTLVSTFLSRYELKTEEKARGGILRKPRCYLPFNPASRLFIVSFLFPRLRCGVSQGHSSQALSELRPQPLVGSGCYRGFFGVGFVFWGQDLCVSRLSINSLCSPSWPGTHSTVQTGLELSNSGSATPVLE